MDLEITNTHFIHEHNRNQPIVTIPDEFIMFRANGKDLDMYQKGRPIFFGTRHCAELYVETHPHVLNRFRVRRELRLINITPSYVVNTITQLLRDENYVIAFLWMYAFNFYTDDQLHRVQRYFSKPETMSKSNFYNQLIRQFKDKNGMKLLEQMTIYRINRSAFLDTTSELWDMSYRRTTRYSTYMHDKLLMFYYNMIDMDGFFVSAYPDNYCSHEIILLDKKDRISALVEKLDSIHYVVNCDICKQRVLDPGSRLLQKSNQKTGTIMEIVNTDVGNMYLVIYDDGFDGTVHQHDAEPI